MDRPPSTSIWDAIRGWADSAGLLLPQDEAPGGEGPKPPVPPGVCENCPICQGAATLEQVNPDIFGELTDVARQLINGMGSALSSAAEQRLAGMAGGHVVHGRAAQSSQPDASQDDPSI